MTAHDAIASYQQRLQIYRRSLAHELQRAALAGGEAFTAVELSNSVYELRTSIRQLKGALRNAGVAVADAFDDEAAAPEDTAASAVLHASPIVELEARPTDGPAPSDLPYASCFISYSHQDEVFAHHLATFLRAAGLHVWIASDDMQGGGKLYEQIKGAIRRQDKLLIVLSEQSMTSEWVKTELRLAHHEELITGQRKLFPIRFVDMPTLRQWEVFDAEIGKDLAVEIREYFIPDFSQWESVDAFEVAFGRLLRDLRANEGR